jgi:adenylate cyclase class 2
VPQNNARHKVREEAEITISDPERMSRILSALGLRPLFRYEKFRTTYALPAPRNLKIEFDETPIGTFLELEGSPSAIDRVAKLLGYAPSDYITRSYGALYIAHSRLHRYHPTRMVFPRTKK